MCTKHMGVRLIGMANKKKMCLGRLWALPNDSKHNEAGFSTISTDSLCLRVAKVPRSRDLAIFVLTTDDRQTNCFTPCCTSAHVGQLSSKFSFHICSSLIKNSCYMPSFPRYGLIHYKVRSGYVANIFFINLSCILLFQCVWVNYNMWI
jgi:hypothetical protein